MGGFFSALLGYLLFLVIYYSLLPSMFGGRARGRGLANNSGNQFLADLDVNGSFLGCKSGLHVTHAN